LSSDHEKWGQNKSVAFKILFSVVISIPETVNVLDLLDVRAPFLTLLCNNTLHMQHNKVL